MAATRLTHSSATSSRLAHCQSRLTASTDDGQWLVHNKSNIAWKHGAHTTTITADGILQREALLGCFANNKGLWLHLVGASAMRFTYASLVGLFNGSALPPLGQPVHTLPDWFQCSFKRLKGWPQGKHPCVRRWRGKCYDVGHSRTTRVGCMNEARNDNWRITFEWFHYDKRATPSQRRPRVGTAAFTASHGTPDAVLVGFELWERARFDEKIARDVKSDLYQGLLAPIADALPTTTMIVLGNGMCGAHEGTYWRGFSGGSPPSQREANAAARRLLNETSKAWIEERQRQFEQGGTSSIQAPPYYFSRAVSMETVPKLTSSPCFAEHPYGHIADLHAALILRFLCQRKCHAKGRLGSSEAPPSAPPSSERQLSVVAPSSACRFAIATTLCASTAAATAPLSASINQANSLLAMLRASGSRLESVALCHGLGPAERGLLTKAGWQRVRDVSLQIDVATAFKPIETPTEGLLWPTRALDRSKLRSHQTTKGDRLRLRAGYVLPYTDGGCSALKLLAWSLVEYDGILLAEPDTTFLERPDEWVYAAHAARRYFVGAYRNLSLEQPTSRGAGSDGLYSSLLWLQPNKLVHRVLSDKARTANYLPRTNTIIDVIESAMPIHAMPSIPMPRHKRGPPRWHTTRGWRAGCWLGGWRKEAYGAARLPV